MVMCKEYRIPLPLTVQEYRIAQLYMLAKKSRQESHGEGSGIEILVNEPYEDGPGPDGKGQYTRKVYHVGSHLPAWVKSLIPKSALSVEEEAWNAYPYTKTRFTCPFVEKFNIELETYYFDDGGHQENVFNLSVGDLKQREVDVIDIVKDQLYGADYVEEEDPTTFKSQKTGRGPLQEDWIKEYWDECKGHNTPLANGKAIMCAYKLIKVEFRYWGMQTKIEKFIHDSALRKTMLRAHRQAWAWLDEWWGLTIEDIRSIERETQKLLAQKYGGGEEEGEEPDEKEADHVNSGEELRAKDGVNDQLIGPLTNQSVVNDRINPTRDKFGEEDHGVRDERSSPRGRQREWRPSTDHMMNEELGKRNSWSRSASRNTLSSHSQASWRMESIRRDSVSSESDDEFFDCQASVVPVIKEDLYEATPSLHKWSSLELLPPDEDGAQTNEECLQNDNLFSPACPLRVMSGPQHRHLLSGKSTEGSVPPSPSLSPSHHPTPCDTTVLLLVVHAGSVLDINGEPTNKKSDLTTFRGAFESVIRQHYPHLIGRVCIRLITAPPVCAASLSVISSLAPHGLETQLGAEQASEDSVPVGALPILGTLTREYEDGVGKTVAALNCTFHEFLCSEEGQGFCGQVCIIGDSVGGVLSYDALCRGVDPHRGEPPSPGDEIEIDSKEYRKSYSGDFGASQEVVVPPHYGRCVSDSDNMYSKHLAAPFARRRSSGSSDHGGNRKIEFEVNDLFLFGCPLGIILVYRKMISQEDKNCLIPRPACQQVYNLFHPTDPLAVRLEPLLSARFSLLAPVTIPRYTKYPLGDGTPTHLLECIQSHGSVFSNSGGLGSPSLGVSRRLSDASILSTVSGMGDTVPMATINALSQRWWGIKRLDYALYCPEGLADFPSNGLPHLFHSSFWESYDVMAFIIRQLVRCGHSVTSGDDKESCVFLNTQPREKWQKKRTSVKIKNIAANHRGNDIIVQEMAPQHIQARFTYGPLDMVALSGEKVDVHVRRDPPTGDWQLLATAFTDKGGRLSLTIPQDKRLSCGIYPVKMIVRGDHTTCSLHLAVVPPRTECVVFSIDGSFTASMSVTGKDPKVRAGAVDVVRHWQELGYLILYITGRPDMQQQKVVSWLAQHNFPHGLVSFADGLSTDPLGHKANYLRTIIQECEVVIHAAYGSAKDIGVYSSLGLKADQIFIVGKANKKQASQAKVLADGYAAHLAELSSLGSSRPARSHPQMVIPKGFFGLPGQNNALRRRRSAKRTSSYPVLGTLPNEGILDSQRQQLQRPNLRPNHMSMKC